MHVRGMCRLALVALARLESGQAKLRKNNKDCDTPRVQGGQNAEKREFHPYCGRWHAHDQCWSNGQGHGCSNCGGHHPSDECRNPNKVISVNYPVANPQQVARDNMRGARPQNGVPNEFRPPNLYYKTNFSSTAGITNGEWLHSYSR